MRKDQWEGQLESIPIEYEIVTESQEIVKTPAFTTIANGKEIPVDKVDCLIAASSGLLTAALDVLWVGEFSLKSAQDIGTEQINNLVIAIAQKVAISKGKGCPKKELKSCIKFLEKEYPMASDKLMNEFGGPALHHLRDFSHHASLFGLICSILNQFTEHVYGTDKTGNLIRPQIPESGAIGTTFREKIMIGVISWFFHLVSDMAGSSSSKGRGTGIPGPILSLAEVLSATPLFRELKIRYKDDDVGFYIWVSKVFSGALFERTEQGELIRFDFRTEMGTARFAGKQLLPVVINQCIVRSFYFVRRLALDFTEKNIQTLSELKLLEPKRFLPFDNRTITHMITISTGVFSLADCTDAAIRTKVKNPNDTVNFVSCTLLRLNFAGIGAFAISIKNEVKYIVEDVRGIMTQQPKALQLLDQRTTEHNTVTFIDVEVDMDNRNLYEYTFADLSNMVTQSREKLLANHTAIESAFGQIFDFRGTNYGAYTSIVEANESRAIKSIEGLVVKMCEQNNIPFEYYPIAPRYATCSFRAQAASRPFQMIRNEESKRIGYAFCDADDVKVCVRAFMAGDYVVDGIKIIRLIDPSPTIYETFFANPNKAFKSDGVSIRIMTLAEMFDELFGTDEYPVFMEYVNNFNAKAKEIIGFNTVLAPTSAALARFKAKTGEMLSTYPYEESIPADVYRSQVKILHSNYLDRKLWRAMIGSSDFAASFITSEWNYNVYQLSENLDMTGIIAGYLKSIEQLLYCVLRISVDKGISIKARDGRIVNFTVENEAQIDTTLGALEAAIQHNGHILDVSPYMKRYLVDTIGEWREKQRNGYFHKHNLHSIEKVDEIRNKALYLYFLILGSCTISNDQYGQLGINTEPENNAFSYEKFVSWLEPVMNYGLPKDTVAVCLTVYNDKNGQWSLQVNGLKTFDKTSSAYEWEENFSTGHNLLQWESVLSEEDTVHMVAGAVKKYMGEGACKKILSAYQAVAVICCFHTEYPYIQ